MKGSNRNSADSDDAGSPAESANSLPVLKPSSLSSEAAAKRLMEQDPKYAIEVMEYIEDRQQRAEALQDSLSMNGSGHVGDQFPVPGQLNRLPNFEERYETILGALDAGNFDDKWTARLLKGIHDAFQYKVPAAKAAAAE